MRPVAPCHRVTTIDPALAAEFAAIDRRWYVEAVAASIVFAFMMINACVAGAM